MWKYSRDIAVGDYIIFTAMNYITDKYYYDAGPVDSITYYIVPHYHVTLSIRERAYQVLSSDIVRVYPINTLKNHTFGEVEAFVNYMNGKV